MMRVCRKTKPSKCVRYRLLALSTTVVFITLVRTTTEHEFLERRSAPLPDTWPQPRLTPHSAVSIYTYDLPARFRTDVLAANPSCTSNQWAFEVMLPIALKERTPPVEASNADFYLVPFPVKCYSNFVARYDRKVVDATYIELLEWIRQKHVWYNRSGGLDHIFIFPSGQGPNIFPSHNIYIPHSIFFVAEGDRSQSFTNPFKDIVVPGVSDIATSSQVSRRNELLAVFRGNIMLSVARQDGTKMKERSHLRSSLSVTLGNVSDIIFSDKKLNMREYTAELHRAFFIICPRGITPWTRRLFDGMFAGTVPVIISDDIQLPFENDLDWSKFTIKISEAEAIKPNTLERILRMHISNGSYTNKVKYLHQVRELFDWRKPYIIDAILLQLERRRRYFKHGSLRTWS